MSNDGDVYNVIFDSFQNKEKDNATRTKIFIYMKSLLREWNKYLLEYLK